MELDSFRINKLHGAIDINLFFENNTLILLGENGSCKTTIIKMLYYTLSLQLEKLDKYNFDSIELKINNKDFIIYKKTLSLLLSNIDRRLFRNLPFRLRNELLMMHDQDCYDLDKIEYLCDIYKYPIDLFFQNIENYKIKSQKENKKNKEQLQKNIDSLKEAVKDVHILYLPTYRRIEQELKVVLEGRFDEDDFHSRHINHIRRFGSCENYTELVEFGMQDVDKAIEDTLTELKESLRANLNQLTLGYLDDIVNGKYQNIELDTIKKLIDEKTIHDIMNRVDEDILSHDSKQKILSTLQHIKCRAQWDYHDKVVCHYFLKLYDSHKELIKKESAIRDFVDVSNKYLGNKKMFYDSPNFDFYIRLDYDEEHIKLSQLSSGEKQIVSLFSHLYLSKKNNYIVLIDEPELSLSVKWQKTFLEDVRKGAFCKGLIAVTHSPFIFDNGLDRYAHGLEEFKYFRA